MGVMGMQGPQMPDMGNPNVGTTPPEIAKTMQQMGKVYDPERGIWVDKLPNDGRAVLMDTGTVNQFNGMGG